MSMSAQTNSSKEAGRSDPREELTLNDERKRVARSGSRENIVRSKSRKSKARSVYRTIRARRDALRRLSDEELLSGLERLHGDERAALLDILLYFIEIKSRRLYVSMGYGSLFEFCVDRYRYSRSTAWRRISAARCIERFPRVAEMFLAGELNLSAISMISGILTKEKAGEILSLVGGNPIKDIEVLVARYRPARVIRDRIKPVFILNPDKARGGGGDAGSTHGADGGSKSTHGPGGGGGNAGSTSPSGTTPGYVNAPAGGDNAKSSLKIETERKAGCASAPGAGRDNHGSGSNTSGFYDAAVPERVVVTKKYKIEFAVEPGFIKRLKKIITLLSPKFSKGIGLEQVIDILMDEYLDHHSPESRMKKRARRGEKKNKHNEARGTDARSERPACGVRDTGCGNHGAAKRTVKEKHVKKSTGIERTRHIPRSIRDQVFVRDGGRCTFISKNGKRCGETWNLEIDHIIPYAKGGDHSPENLRLLCAQHNRLAAEDEYGAEHMKKFYRRE